MASWLVSRLVSGLGVATTAAAHPLALQASCEAASGPLARLAAGAWGRWPAPGHPGARRAFSGATAAPASTSPPAAASATWPVAASADLPTSATGPAQGALPAFLRPPPSLKCAAVIRVGAILAAATTTTTASHSARSTSTTAFYSSAAAATATAGGGAAASAPATTVAVETGASSSGAAAAPEPKPDLVEKLLSLDVANSSARRRAERQQVLRDFQSHPADTGTPPVMVALWTHRVRSLVRVFDSGRKQLPSIRQLEMLVNRRRRMLTWLRRTNFESYSYTISKLGLRDIYVPAGGEHRYREGVRQGDPVDDDINRLRFNFHTKYRQGKTSLWKRLRPKLVAEDPALQSADAEAAVEDRQRRQQRREVAAQQRMAAEREREQSGGARRRQ